MEIESSFVTWDAMEKEVEWWVKGEEVNSTESTLSFDVFNEMHNKL